jgi:hypothetical protein
MTPVAQRLQEIVDSYDPPDRPPLSDMPIHVITRYVELVKQGESTTPVSMTGRLELVRAHRATIVRRSQELQAALAVVDYKITTYGGNCSP